MQQTTIEISKQENKSIALLSPFFTLIPANIPLGDVRYVGPRTGVDYCIELKLGNDLYRNYWKDVEDQLARMLETPGPEYHIVWIVKLNENLERDINRFYHLAFRARVCAHLCSPGDLPAQLHRIFSGIYHKPIEHVLPPAKLTILARMLACYPGISEPVAKDLADRMRSFGYYLENLPAERLKMLGLYADSGEIKKIAYDLDEFLMGDFE